MTGRDFGDDLKHLADQAQLRTLQIRRGAGGKFSDGQRTILNFSSNDYLNLANDGRLKAGAAAATAELGCSAGASRLMSGHLEIHQRLEDRLAEWIGTEAALAFGSGFLTNLGVMTALAGRGDVIFADRLNHASLVDGALLSRAKLVRYRHCDTDDLRSRLAEHVGRRKIIVTDSIFSMDGDLAPLEAIAELAKLHDALLVVDEAHAVGVVGPGGRGVLAGLGLTDSATVIVATMSKALGGYGGFAACSGETRHWLINRARSFIYSTGLPPACMGSALAAIDAIKNQPNLGADLLDRAAYFRDKLSKAGLNVAPSDSQIVPVILGDNATALAASKILAAQGILATAVRPPTVPKGTARLRLSVTLAHTREDLAHAAEQIVAACRKPK